MGNITGQDFRSWVTDQISVRQSKLGASNRDADNLAWQTNSTAFLRLCSAVNISQEKSIELTGTENYADNALAEKYILFGGTSDGSGHEGFRSGVLNSSYSTINEFAYGFNSSAENRGLIPMPGLESATITPLNRGALKKAQIKIKCHSKEQFAIIDALYMRPGYTILLEWGHTMYFNNNGVLETSAEDFTPAFNTLINRSGDQDDILSQIDKERESSDGNYDGFYGKITNFDWSFNADGSYNITVNAISIGDVIETLNMNNADFEPSADISPKEDNGVPNTPITGSTTGSIDDSSVPDQNPVSTPQFIVDKNKSKLNNWLYYVYNEAGKRRKKNLKTTSGFKQSKTSKYELTASSMVFRPSFTGGKIGREVIRINNKVAPSENGDTTKKDESTYIRLGAILKYIQDYLLFYDEKGKSYISIDWDYDDNYCFTFPEHYSVNPMVCVIPFQQPFSKNKTYTHGKYGKVWYSVLGGAFRDTKSNFVGKLMNIHVNVDHIDNCIQNNLTDGKIALLPFLESLMSGIQRALGDINKFSVTYDSETNYIKIIDEIPLDSNVTKTGKNVALFNTYGVDKDIAGSFVTNVSLNATITNEFATMISIGAQARNDGKKANTSTLTAFNKGLVDGITPQKLSKEDANSKKKDTETFSQVYSNSYRKIFKNGSLLFEFYWKNKKPTLEAINAEYSIASELFRVLAAHYNRNNGVGGVEGFLPFDLGLEIKGLSGPRIYERFFITEDILPESYRKNIAFLVKGLQHNIDISGWKTTIDSMAYQSVGKAATLPETTEVGSAGEIPSGDEGYGGESQGINPDEEFFTLTSGYPIINWAKNGPFFRRIESEKTGIVLHYTVGGNPESTVATWNRKQANKNYAISTHFVIGKDGQVEQLYDLKYFGSHTGTGRIRNKSTIGIEICNWGYGGEGQWDRNTQRAKLVDKYGNEIDSWRGVEDYEYFPDAQVEGVKQAILQISAAYPNIPLTFNYDQCFPPDQTLGSVGGEGTYEKYRQINIREGRIDKNAINNVPGIYTHNSYKPRGHKFDIPPAENMINMLKSLTTGPQPL